MAMSLDEAYPIFSIVGTSVIIVLLLVEIWYAHQARNHRMMKTARRGARYTAL